MADVLNIPADLFDLSGFAPAPEQREAVETAARSRVLVITGGPGVGKTWTVNQVVRLFKANGLRVLLAAPTGKAALRMREQTGEDATTIHRLLGWSPSGFRFNADAPVETDDAGNRISGPLNCDALIVDETSMVDVELFASIVQALGPNQRLVLVGDVDQLPSIGAGRVLHDLIESGAVPAVRLTRIFRQASESRIPYVARDINAGVHVDTSPLNAKTGGSDVAWLSVSDEEQLQATMVEAVANLIPARRGIPSSDIQVLCPQHRGPVGDEVLNTLLQQRLNPNYSESKYEGLMVGRGYRVFADDRVIHATRNNYDLQVVNGETGVVLDVAWKGLTDLPNGTVTSEKGKVVLTVKFADRVVGYTKQEAECIELAYAITVHKSQGSQFPCVVVPVHSANEFMLTRPLLYTAVTRAEKLLFMLGEEEALNHAANNTRGVERRTTLQPCLRGDCA